MTVNVVLLPLARVRCTEEVCPWRVDEVLTMIRQRQAWTQPICIEATVGALLDGHHRYAAARLLGLVRIPAFVFDYADVELGSWRHDVLPTRAEVVARALSGTLYPRKTTRHSFAARVVRPIPLCELVDRAEKTSERSGTALRSFPPASARDQGEDTQRRHLRG